MRLRVSVPTVGTDRRGRARCVQVDDDANEMKPRPWRPTRGSRLGDLVVNVSLLGLWWLAYRAARGLTSDAVTTAFDNAVDILAFQEWLGLPSERTLQQALLQRTTVIRAANAYYLFVHFPATVLFLAWMWLRHRAHFDRVRNTLIAVTVVGLVGHVIYPLAPPRMLSGFVDTGAVIGPDPYDLEISSAANQIAAMPSLHVGWALIVALGVIWVLDSAWRFSVLAHPVLTVFVVVVTANHYWIDAVVAVLLVVPVWLAFRRFGRHLEPTPESLERATPKDRDTTTADRPAWADGLDVTPVRRTASRLGARTLRTGHRPPRTPRCHPTDPPPR